MPDIRRLAIFDFDGTITREDSLFSFLKFSVSSPYYYWGLIRLFPIFIALKIGWKTPQKAKEQVLAFYLKGKSKEEITQLSKQFTQTIVPKIIRPKALLQIEEHLAKGDQVYVCSASADWITPWCKLHDLHVLCSQLAYDQKRQFTGKLVGKNCNGEEKVNRIRKAIDLGQYQEIIAYGDSNGDRPMFELAHHSFYKPFRKE